MIDLVSLHFKAGKGGDGRVSFFRAKFIPKGGPDGGNGGDGGSIYLVGDKNINTLSDFTGKKGFSAEEGAMGGKTQMIGRKGDDLYIKVPVGTTIWDVGDIDPEELRPKELSIKKLHEIEKTLIVEILEEGQEFLFCKGGKGGRGNEAFKSSSNTTPMEAEPGSPGQERQVLFELKLLADVGLVGFPNAGKSTFLSLITKANPRIANYPFTTLEPNLGVLTLGGDKAGEHAQEVVIADIPGLIEGASDGKGLGIQFLRHVERCRLLMFVLYLDETVVYDEELSMQEKAGKIIEQYQTLTKELHEYSEQLEKLPRFITVNKTDLYNDELRAEITRQLRGNPTSPRLRGTDQPSSNGEAILWSAITKEGIDHVKDRIQKLLTLKS